MNSIVCLLHNTATNRWHPILFVESPLPSESKLVRHKSKCHHTEGFESREAANASATELAAKVQARLLLDDVGEWNGTATPAAVRFFDLSVDAASNR